MRDLQTQELRNLINSPEYKLVQDLLEEEISDTRQRLNASSLTEWEQIRILSEINALESFKSLPMQIYRDKLNKER